ncbi:uncharacterized protein LOC142628698 [Castanea sativa]|uniref:uncharacterized protein LOC142628698 n=1 Tax=Castanea sativa TaxID=21020 RepID=UPI003F64B3E3
MTENQSSVAFGPVVRSEDPAWAYGRAVPDVKNNTQCIFCSKMIRGGGGGITRLKYHLAGIKGDVEVYRKVSEDVKWQMKQLLEDLKKSKKKKRRISKQIANPYDLEEEDDDDDHDEGNNDNGRGGSKSHSSVSNYNTKGKEKVGERSNIKSFFAPRTIPGSQSSIKSSLASKQMVEKARMNFARWWYHANIPFHVARSVYYQEAIDSIAAIGPGKKLMQKYGLFYWSPCAAYCIDLMLEKFSDRRYFPIIHETIQKAKKITKFIYNHGKVLSLMRSDFTNGRDLVRPAITRFSTEFLSLQCLTKFKKELRQMFTCDQWVESRYARDVMGKMVAALVLEDKEFWLQCQQIVKISEPLVRVLRLVDGDEKPSMGYLYEAMDKAKENIKARLKNKISAYIPFTSVIDARWDKQLHSPLHAAEQKEITKGLLSTITRLVPDPDEQDSLSSQIEAYKKALGDFGMPMAIRQREKLNLVAWWEQFGNDTPELQKFAIRVLSQCCSATGCERAWSTFEFIHSKRRNRLDHKRLNDLVFVRYNLLLRERNIRRTKDYLDPISLDNIDLVEDWVAEESEFSLLTEEDVNWASIEEPLATMNLEDNDNDDDDVVVLDEDNGDDDVVLTNANTHVYYGPDVDPFDG